MGRKHRRIGRGVLAGLAAGLAASWTMNQFQALWSSFSQQLSSDTQQQPEQESQGESEDATMKAADRVSRGVLHHPLSHEQKKKAGPLVHYVFGSSMGALYGVAAELAPNIATRGFGTGFGATLFAVADEMAVPAFGLAGKPTESPLSSHIYALASHLVYGATAEAVRRAAVAAL